MFMMKAVKNQAMRLANCSGSTRKQVRSTHAGSLESREEEEGEDSCGSVPGSSLSR